MNRSSQTPGMAIRVMPGEPVVRAGSQVPLFAIHGSLTFTPEQAAAIDLAWARLTQASPRLFDGPILAVDRAAMSGGPLVCRRSTYKPLLAAIPEIDIRALGVQGLVVGRDPDGDECVLMGRRSAETRIYAGLWENAPSGTVAGPGRGASGIGPDHFLRSLREEGLEELGLDLQATGSPAVRWIALLEDAHARSIDVVFRIDLGPGGTKALPCPTNDAARWEYIDAAWVPIPRLAAWLARSASAISPPTAALFRSIGWA